MEFSNVKLVFLPPNTTVGTQPLDSGIIRNFKVKYRKMLPEFLLSHKNVIALANAMKKVNAGDVVDWVSQSWDQVATSTIKNCFRKPGLNKDAAEPEEDDRPAQDQEEMFHLAKVAGVEWRKKL